MSRLSALAPLLLLLACTPRIRIEWTRPAAFSLPTDKKVALVVETDGVAPSAGNVLDTAIGLTQGQVLNKWLAIEPLRNELGTQLAREGYNLVDRDKADVLVRVQPTAWSYQLGKAGDLKNGSGRLDAKVDVLEAKNASAPAIYRQTYWATASANNVGELEAMVRASQRLTRVFLGELKPSRVSAQVELDDSDPVTETGVALAKDGKFEAAYAAFSDAVARKPESAPALYDLAVLHEARGEYDQAEELLRRATSISPRPIYYEALERVSGARKDAQAINAR
jgi:tetratricopeptide (TPR) repeat protein